MDLYDRWKQNSLWVKSVVLNVLDDVRFTPDSGHCADTRRCPLCANTDQSACSKMRLLDHFVGSIRKCRQSRIAAHNFLDGLGAPAALRAAAEVGIDLAHPHLLSGFGKGATNLTFAEEQIIMISPR